MSTINIILLVILVAAIGLTFWVAGIVDRDS